MDIAGPYVGVTTADTMLPNAPLHSHSRLRRLLLDRRGSTSLVLGASMSCLLMVAGLGIEVSNWTVGQAELQRIADAAAVAGANELEVTSNGQNATYAAADVAELNGAAGTKKRAWNALTLTLVDNDVTVRLKDPVLNKNATYSVQVTVTRTVPLLLLRLVNGKGGITLSATSSAEPQLKSLACMVALKSGGISGQGNVSANLSGCAMRSNGGISTGGSASFTASGFYAAGSITGSVSGGPITPNDGTTKDPYAGYAPAQSAMAAVASASGTPPDASQPKSAVTRAGGGSYGGDWDIKGDVTLTAGTYYLNGDLSLGAKASLTGIGATLVVSGNITMSGGASLNITAPVKGAPGVPGVAIIALGTSSSLGGNSGITATGGIYMPNADLTFNGTPGAGSLGCLQVVAASIQMRGNSSMAFNCNKPDYGTPPAYVDTPVITAVQ